MKSCLTVLLAAALVACGPGGGAPGLVDPLLADGRSPDTLSDGFAVGGIVLMTLTGQPGIDLVSRCGGMLGHPEEPGRWRSPGVPDAVQSRVKS